MKKASLLLILIFLLTQLLGLYLGSEYVKMLNARLVQPVFSDPESIQNSIYLFTAIPIVTAFIILVIKFREEFFRVIELSVIFFCSWITFDLLIGTSMFPLPLGLFLALLLVGWRILRPTILNQNITLITSASGVGAVLGASLGIFPCILLMVFLSIYDYISVFITRHMVFIGRKLVRSSSAMVISAPSDLRAFLSSKDLPPEEVSKRMLHLGGGDIVVPLMFTVSVFSSYGVISSLSVIASSAGGLALLMLYLSKRPEVTLPGLPFICSGCLLGFFLSTL